MKICAACGLEKPESEFSPSKNNKGGLKRECKSCRASAMRLWYSKPENKAKARQTQVEYLKDADNKRRKLEVDAIYRADPINKAKTDLYNHEYYQENKEEIKAHVAEKRKDPATKTKRNIKTKERKATDIQFLLSVNLRGRLSSALKRGFKSGSAVRDLGCSIAELKTHLESRFKPGMTWENYGRNQECWSIDHIMPLAAFDLSNRQHVLLACYYLNLQPLWHEENSRKKDTIPTEILNEPVY